MDRTAEYEEVTKPSRIKLKETKNEKADRLYRREQRRHARESERISRANGYAVSPPRPTRTRTDSISPPRNPPKRQYDDVLDDDDGGAGGDGEWMGGFGRKAKEELEAREWRDRMAWMARSEAQDPFGYHGPGATAGLGPDQDLHIPHRFRAAAAAGGPSHHSHHHRRRAAEEVEFSGGPVPPLGAMTEEEYSSWIREGMHRRKHRDEIEAAERRQRAKEEKERLKEAEREQKIKENERKMKRLKRRNGEDEEKKRKDERIRWKERWRSLGDKDNEIVETELSYNDIPWPIFRPMPTSTSIATANPLVSLDDLTIGNIRNFIHAIAEDDNIDQPDIRKTIRDAIRNYHPDKFNARLLHRVRQKDREMVKEAVLGVSGVLNDLAKEGK